MFITPKNHLLQVESMVSALSTEAVLLELTKQFPGQITFSTSFSYEDQVIAHQILESKLSISIFTLDTGRLFPETYSVWNATNEKYATHIRAYYPNQPSVENMISAKGPNSFYVSVDNRKECCFIRKVEPLKRALAGNIIWITGLRAEHSLDRHDIPQVEWDETNNIIKYHPLLHWTFDNIKKNIRENNIPYNPLHDKGFVSIGCAPCTRAIRPGEDFRAGRWWWEDGNKKECGLHVHASSEKMENDKIIK